MASEAFDLTRRWPDWLTTLIDGQTVGRLATVRQGFEDSQMRATNRTPTSVVPHLVPIVFARLNESVISPIDGKPKRHSNLQRGINIAGNPRICLLLDHYDPDWSKLWWVRLDGIARETELSVEAIAALRRKYPNYIGDISRGNSRQANAPDSNSPPGNATPTGERGYEFEFERVSRWSAAGWSD